MKSMPTVHSEEVRQFEHPAYRVNFWERPFPNFAWNLDAWVLSEVRDVEEAVAWVKEHANGRPYEIFAEVEELDYAGFDAPRTSNLVRLSGSSPNDPNFDDA